VGINEQLAKRKQKPQERNGGDKEREKIKAYRNVPDPSTLFSSLNFPGWEVCPLATSALPEVSLIPTSVPSISIAGTPREKETGSVRFIPDPLILDPLTDDEGFSSQDSSNGGSERGSEGGSGGDSDDDTDVEGIDASAESSTSSADGTITATTSATNDTTKQYGNDNVNITNNTNSSTSSSQSLNTKPLYPMPISHNHIYPATNVANAPSYTRPSFPTTSATKAPLAHSAAGEISSNMIRPFVIGDANDMDSNAFSNGESTNNAATSSPFAIADPLGFPTANPSAMGGRPAAPGRGSGGLGASAYTSHIHSYGNAGTDPSLFPTGSTPPAYAPTTRGNAGGMGHGLSSPFLPMSMMEATYILNPVQSRYRHNFLHPPFPIEAACLGPERRRHMVDLKNQLLEVDLLRQTWEAAGVFGGGGGGGGGRRGGREGGGGRGEAKATDERREVAQRQEGRKCGGWLRRAYGGSYRHDARGGGGEGGRGGTVASGRGLGLGLGHLNRGGGGRRRPQLTGRGGRLAVHGHGNRIRERHGG